LYNLDIITVRVGSSSKQSYKNILINLFPNDTGEETPNLSNYYLFEGTGWVFSPKKQGRPYIWAQEICTMKFLPKENIFDIDSITTESSFNKVANIINRIKERIISTQSLNDQLETLSKGKIPVEIKTFVPIRSNIILESFEEIDADEFYGRKKNRKSKERGKNRHSSKGSSAKEEGEIVDDIIEDVLDNEEIPEEIVVEENNNIENIENIIIENGNNHNEIDIENDMNIIQ